MEKTSKRIKQFLNDIDIIKKLIFINVVIFIILNIVTIFQGLFGLSHICNLEENIALSSKWSHLSKFWTPLTYMFVQKDFLHLLLNMIILFFYGRLFLTFFRPQQLLALYILGGLAGALFFLISYSIFPYFATKYPSLLIGSSASLMAIIFGVSIYRPNLEVKLFGVFDIKLIYLALILFILDFLNILSTNGGGHIAHIGGAFIGYLFASFYIKGKDITYLLQVLFDYIKKIGQIFFYKQRKHNSKTKRKGNHKSKDSYRTNFHKKMNEEEIDIILDKIKSSGYASLTREEKKKLFDAGNQK